MAKTIIIILALFAANLNVSFGKSYKSADFANAENIIRMIEVYHRKSAILPKSWQEIEESTEIEQVSNGFEYRSKYGFPKKEVTISIQGQQSQIIVMAVSSGGEGDRIERNDAGRLVLLYRDKNIFEVTRIRESILSEIFREAGYSLSDYTGKKGKWSNTDELESIQKDDQEKVVDPQDIDSQLKKNFPREDGSTEIQSKDGTASKNTNTFIWAIIFFCVGIVGYVTWILIRRKQR